jgi:hypothetical protein
MMMMMMMMMLMAMLMMMMMMMMMLVARFVLVHPRQTTTTKSPRGAFRARATKTDYNNKRATWRVLCLCVQDKLQQQTRHVARFVLVRPRQTTTTKAPSGAFRARATTTNYNNKLVSSCFAPGTVDGLLFLLVMVALELMLLYMLTLVF